MKLLLTAIVFTAMVFVTGGSVYAQGESGPELDGRTVILDAGHGWRNSPGFAGYSEEATMLRLAFMIKPLLEARGAEVILIRETRYDIPLPVRAAMINLHTLEVLAAAGRNTPAAQAEFNRLKAAMRRIINDFEEYGPVYFNFPFDFERNTVIHPDLLRIFELQAIPAIQDNFLVISLHSNAVAPLDTRVHGAYVYFMQNGYYKSETYFDNYASPERSELFGDILLDKIDALGIVRREVRPGNWFIIREHNLPGVLAENGFHTNAHDRALLSCNDWLERLAHAYADAITQYFESIPPPPPPEMGILREAVQGIRRGITRSRGVFETFISRVRGRGARFTG